MMSIILCAIITGCGLNACTLSRKDLNIPQETIDYLPHDVAVRFLTFQGRPILQRALQEALQDLARGSQSHGEHSTCIFGDGDVRLWRAKDDTHPPGAKPYGELRIDHILESAEYLVLYPANSPEYWCIVNSRLNAVAMGNSRLSQIRKTVAALAALGVQIPE